MRIREKSDGDSIYRMEKRWRRLDSPAFLNSGRGSSLCDLLKQYPILARSDIVKWRLSQTHLEHNANAHRQRKKKQSKEVAKDSALHMKAST